MEAVGAIELVSEAVKNTIDFLRFEGLLCSELLLVGHSLGVQILGSAALNVKCNVSYLIGRILF